MSQKIKWGVIGCGVISRTHLEGAAMSDCAEVVAVCDIVREKAEEKAKLYDVKKVYTDYMDLINDPEVEAISVCVPSGIHGEVCIAAANAKKHILCEKPVEITKEKIDAIEKAVKENGVKLACVFQMRYDEPFQITKKAVEDGLFGKPVMASAYLKFNRDQAYYDKDAWRGTWALDGGGCLMNQGVHGIDLMTWILGDVESVYAKCANKVRKGIEVEDTAMAIVQFKNGCTATIEGSTCCYPGMLETFEFHFEKGSIIVKDVEGIVEWKMQGEDLPMPTWGKVEAVSAKDDPTKLVSTSHFLLISDLCRAIRENTDPYITIDSARKGVELILAIYESSQKKQEIFL